MNTSNSTLSEKSLDHLNTIEREWITDKNSLTLRLREFTQQKITLELKYDNEDDMDTMSRTILKATSSEKPWVRRIIWSYEGTPWLSCQVVIPKSSITGETQHLTQIGTGSIGDILFKDTTLTRDAFLFEKKDDHTIARHSVFYYKKQPLLVSETFLPAFFEALKKH